MQCKRSSVALVHERDELTAVRFTSACTKINALCKCATRAPAGILTAERRGRPRNGREHEPHMHEHDSRMGEVVDEKQQCGHDSGWE